MQAADLNEIYILRHEPMFSLWTIAFLYEVHLQSS
jgi:hypothetical protein